MAGDDGTLTSRVVRERTLADTVGPDMRLLVCGVNPSPYSADAGIGYARPGNRFWPAALAAGLVPVDRDPVAALAGGYGMTDFAKRPTRTAAEVTRDEYGAGFARVAELVGWLRPGAVCFVGLSGWRPVVDRGAVAGPQPTGVGRSTGLRDAVHQRTERPHVPRRAGRTTWPWPGTSAPADRAPAEVHDRRGSSGQTGHRVVVVDLGRGRRRTGRCGSATRRRPGTPGTPPCAPRACPTPTRSR